jgi:pimeloyl-[acyl-carrier protein] methyl ester esterase
MLWLPGWAAPSAVWADVAAQFAPGGGSTCDFSVARVPGDHLELAASALSRVGAPAHVVGWSLGAMVALELARAEPELVTSLALVGATDRFVARDDRIGWSPRVLSRMRARLATEAGGVVGDLDRRMFGPAERARGEDERWLAARAAELQPVVALDAGLAYLETFEVDGGSIRVPTRLLHGRDDAVCPVAGAERLAHSLPHGTLTIWDDVGHAPFWTRPAAFAAWLGDCGAP